MIALITASMAAAAPQDMAIAAPGQSLVPSQGLEEVRQNDLLLLSVLLDGQMLTDALAGYGEIDDPLVPIGELSRLLYLDVTAFPADRRATGVIGEARRPLMIDVAGRVARIGDKTVPLATGDAAVTANEGYLRASAITKLFPIRIRIDGEALQMTLTATEVLPIQARSDRDARRQQLGRETADARPVMRVDSPYGLLATPSVDVALETGHDRNTGLTTRRYDVRIGADIARAGLTGYLGSDETGKPATVRLKLERRAADGGLLGPIDATAVAIGDVFTPIMTTGPRSAAGRGFAFTTAPVGQTSVFQRITLRGELPIGYDVELYVNDVLRSGQRSPIQGRYEFVDVPLSRGLNVLRIVTYGPHGERAEQTRRLNVGGGEAPRGQLSVDFGIVQQDRAVVDLKPERDPTLGRGGGHLRAVSNLTYGLTDRVTIVGGFALYPDSDGHQRRLISAGGRGSLLGVALLGDYARDLTGGSALSLGVAAQALGVGLTARQIAYSGTFIDENNHLYDGVKTLKDYSSLYLDFNLRLQARNAIPVSLGLERTRFRDGSDSWTGFGRASAMMADTLISGGLDYRGDRRRVLLDEPTETSNARLGGNLAASRFFDRKWQLRGVANFDIAPRTALDSLSLTADRSVGQRANLRFGLGRSFGPARDFNAQAGAAFRLPFADIALTGEYALKAHWRLSLRLAFGFGPDPWTGGMRMARPGIAAGGSAVVNAFIDQNGNGLPDPDEKPVAGVVVQGGERKAVTGRDGRAYVSGLGDGATASVHADVSGIDAFFVSAPPQDIDFPVRPGKVLGIAYPLTPVSEVLAHAWIVRDGKRTGLAAVRLRLIRDGAAPLTATTEYDGSVMFENVRPAVYRLELDPAQAEKLHMHLAQPAAITVRDDGRAEEVNVDIAFERHDG